MFKFVVLNYYYSYCYATATVVLYASNCIKLYTFFMNL